jgi:beta-phosphoglucomutase-like phosphatase (HAD superfamily)
MRIEPVFLFDLDGTLVDSVYEHVLAWKEALDSEGIELSVWRIHRKIGIAAASSPISSFVRPASPSTKGASSG